MVLLTQAKNVKYKSFAAPGMNIRYTITAKSIEENLSSFSGAGVCDDGQAIVEARFSLRHFNLADKDPKMVIEDGHIISKLKERYRILSAGIVSA